jgi:hypothetical protein
MQLSLAYPWNLGGYSGPADGSTTPSTAQGSDFGSVVQGGSNIAHVFGFGVFGTYVYILAGAAVPAGFILQPLHHATGADIAYDDGLYGGGGYLFRLTLDASAAVGVKAGIVTLNFDSGDFGPEAYTFAVTGEVTAAPAGGGNVGVLGNGVIVPRGT